jgi:hypothetical protein
MNNNNSSKSLPAKLKSLDWHFYSWIGIKLAQAGIFLFLLLIFCKLALDNITYPYNYFIAGIAICIFGAVFFGMIRVHTFKPRREAYDLSRLSTRNALLDEVMKNLDFEITKFENGANYYFQQVSSFKYTTVILSGISTIVLGLDLSGVEMPLPVDYTLLSKNIALVIGSVITVMTTMFIFWNLEKYWLQNKIILQRFRQLREEIELADKKKILNPNEIDDFCERFKKIKFDFYKYWEGVQAERNKQ